MVLPIVILVVIPIFLGISYVAPFEPPEIEESEIPENSGATVLYVLLMGIWVIFLLRIIILMKKGSFKLTQRY